MKHAPAHVVTARPWHFLYLAERMRPDEQRHVLALTGADHYNADVAAEAAIRSEGLRFALLGDDGAPVVAGGYVPVRGHCWEAWMMGTLEGWEKHWIGITRGVRWTMARMFEQGATRIQVMTLADRLPALEWYERALGMQCDGKLCAAGARGEDLVIYSRVPGGSP